MKQYSFIKPDPKLQNNLMAFGYDCGEGWHPLIEELFDKIQDIVNNNPEYSELEIVQVKEKWATLTIYLNYYYPEIEKLIEEYQEKSAHICEVCGHKGKICIHNHWYKTVCWWHDFLWQYDNWRWSVKFKWNMFWKGIK